MVGVMATVTISRGFDRGWCNGYSDHSLHQPRSDLLEKVKVAITPTTI
jgi:hypothetical protein